MKKILYPNPQIGAFSQISKRSLWRSLRTGIENWTVAKREQKLHKEVPLNCVSSHGKTGIYPDDLPLIFLVRNERWLLPNFLWHYRKLGVTRFISVDDASTDGTLELLLAQSDVDVWQSPLRYKDASRGRSWREKLFDIYGRDRWYVNVDSDEFLVYEGCDERNLWSVVHGLEESRYQRLAAPMIDMYPLDIEQARVEKLAHFMPWEIADHFDASGYELRVKKRAPSLRGGARLRKFGHSLEMMKYPLIYWDDQCRLGSSIHQPLPYERNFVPLMGALLHFKMFSDFEEKVRLAVAGGQYYNGSAAYRAAMDSFGTGRINQMSTKDSVKFAGVEQLVTMGFFERLPTAARIGD